MDLEVFLVKGLKPLSREPERQFAGPTLLLDSVLSPSRYSRCFRSEKGSSTFGSREAFELLTKM